MTPVSQDGQSTVSNREQPATREQRGTSVNHVKYSGIHNRRDKRYPFRSGRLRPEDLAEAEAYEAQKNQSDEGTVEVPAWQEALMLWLSWNSTYEKLTAKMCKPGQSQAKLEALMDELDQLRASALQLSEKLIKQPG